MTLYSVFKKSVYNPTWGELNRSDIPVPIQFLGSKPSVVSMWEHSVMFWVGCVLLITTIIGRTRSGSFQKMSLKCWVTLLSCLESQKVYHKRLCSETTNFKLTESVKFSILYTVYSNRIAARWYQRRLCSQRGSRMRWPRSGYPLRIMLRQEASYQLVFFGAAQFCSQTLLWNCYLDQWENHLRIPNCW